MKRNPILIYHLLLVKGILIFWLFYLVQERKKIMSLNFHNFYNDFFKNKLNSPRPNENKVNLFGDYFEKKKKTKLADNFQMIIRKKLNISFFFNWRLGNFS